VLCSRHLSEEWALGATALSIGGAVSRRPEANVVSEPRVVATSKIREAWPPISEDEVELPSGARRRWIRIHYGTSAAVLAVTKEKQVLLTREYRHGLGRVVVSLPGGVAHDGETAEVCARRELLEETGYDASRLLEMYTGNSLTGYLEGMLHLFFTRDPRPTGRRPNPDEVASLERVSVTQALADARSGAFESTVVTLAILMADARGWLVA